ncbi:hypothetical protein BKA70DRAFT_1562665 [Coprinopsis sp. MPI-PUGE-AT-0042]|nr:hypothetical protein BKA70DRAFT_1562665 [Coprinopsis sp. MPI-PUGE-AT-0042]
MEAQVEIRIEFAEVYWNELTDGGHKARYLSESRRSKLSLYISPHALTSTRESPKPKRQKLALQRNSQLLKLSSEVQLAIVKHVDALGLLRLEQTCKHFFQLVNDPKAGIWRQRLRSHSTTHNLFWPSFKDLTTVQDFKGAATASLKFAKFSAGMSDSTPLSKFKSDVQLSRDIEEGPMHLIPGGRYVVMLEAEQVSVVDLHAKDGEDSIVATYETERPLTVAEGCVWVAENGMKVYILQQFTSPIKQRINSRDPCKSTTTTYTLLEFGLGENLQALTDDEMGVTVIWNPVDNEVAALRVGCLGSEAPDNIGKSRSLALTSLDDDTIIMSDLRPNTVECYTAKLSRALASVQERNILIPASPGLPVLYDFLVKDTEADSLHVHRHALEFNP